VQLCSKGRTYYHGTFADQTRVSGLAYYPLLFIQGYKELLQQYESWFTRPQSGCQATLLMVLPSHISLAKLPNRPSEETVNQIQGGIGYARLAIQVVAYCMEMECAWMLDDNIQDMYRLEYKKMLRPRVIPTDYLKQASFADVMGALEQKVCQSVGYVLEQ
jgi:hypothetical protein